MFKVSTKNLQSMVNKLGKCNNNKLLEITRYYKLSVSEGGLCLIATDGNNFISVVDKTVSGDKFETIVKADQFSRLVLRTSVDKMSFDLKENYLEVVGNGKYKVEILTDEQYPSFEFSQDDQYKTEVALNTLQSVSTVNKHAISTTIADGVLTGYLFKDGNCVTADGIKVCVTPAKFVDRGILITPDMMALLGALTQEKVNVFYENGKLAFVTDDTTIFGSEMDGQEQYPEIGQLTNIQFPSKCSLSKLAVMNILDRLTLFIDPFEKNEVQLDFTKDGLVISTNSGSYEILAYATSENFQEFSCCVNGLFFKELVSAVGTELFELSYGEEELIRLDSNGVCQLLATGEGEE